MIEALPYIGVFIAAITFGAVIYSFGYVHGSQDQTGGALHWAEARWEAFFKRWGRGS